MHLHPGKHDLEREQGVEAVHEGAVVATKGRYTWNLVVRNSIVRVAEAEEGTGAGVGVGGVDEGAKEGADEGAVVEVGAARVENED